MARYLSGIALLLLWLPANAAPQNLATIGNYYLDFQTDLEFNGCEAHLRKALDEGLIKTTSKQDYADAIYVVKVDLKKSTRMRATLTWAAAVYSRENRVLFSKSAEESGWNVDAACLDAAEDIADELADEVREARVNRGRIPEPRYRLVAEPRSPVATSAIPLPTVAPVPRPAQKKQRSASPYELKEKAIDSDVGAEVRASERATNEPSKWRRAASGFAESHGCSQDFQSVQPLPSGAEIYVTSCGIQQERAFITCSSYKRCNLSF